MDRRTYLVTTGSAVSALLAGCTNDTSDDGNPGGSSSSDTDTPTATATETADSSTAEETSTDTPDESTPTPEQRILTTVDAYFEAATRENLDALAEYMHSHHPFNPDNLDEENRANFEFEYADVENYERELIEEELDTEKVRNAPTVAPLFENNETSLDEILAGEQAALVQVRFEATEDDETVQNTEQFIMLTEDGQWRVFLPYRAPTEIPDGEPVDTDKYQLVENIEYNTETERARVFVSGTGNIEAEKLVVYSTSLQTENGVWSDDSRTLPDVNYFTTGFDPSGDEIVVALRMYDGEEIVIYRDQYQPDS
jgi:hypothetical protein